MPQPTRSFSGTGGRFRPGLAFILLAILLSVLWIAGGASRADAIGQVVVRATAWALLVVAILFGKLPSLRPVWPVGVLLAAALALALVQLVPLPPGLWKALPGRAMFLEAAAAMGQSQPWRPWSLVPEATVNAASSLVVPFAVLLLASGLDEKEQAWLPGVLLSLVTGSALIGLLQYTSGGIDNPLINETISQVSGTFANRNHFALFVAIGFVLAPVWAFFPGRRPAWRVPMALGLVLLFSLMLLTVGSRAGLILGLLALVLGIVLTRRGIRAELARYPRWGFLAVVAVIVGLIAMAILASILAGRAISIDRIMDADPGQDMRARGLPVVLTMIRTYLPWGTGLGGFDPIFRIHEPFGLLKPTYFNHAHNDLLEIGLDAGLPGIVLVAAGLIWWVRASVRAWWGIRNVSGRHVMTRRAGSAILLLVLLASFVDYPSRTPMIMAYVVLAGMWLARSGAGSSSLPHKTEHL